MTELKPCPFCGNDKLSWNANSISCVCGAVMVVDSMDYFPLEAWNARTPEPTLNELRDKVYKKLTQKRLNAGTQDWQNALSWTLSLFPKSKVKP